MIFFVDAMLGNIARKLRLLGFDSEYFPDIEDSKLIEKAQTECRTIISRDYSLIQRAKKKGIPTIYVSKEDEFEQFLEIFKNTGLNIKKISGDTARCTKCNAETFRVDKSESKTQIPHLVLEQNDFFWQCEKCPKIYWEGTHIKNLQKFVDTLKQTYELNR
ncbi:Mut7-C RNAse domain-containing protein [Nitrosopumilus sp.]|uniref:Mut7-C RNAse domain-containing protein n=1 Tax=Nitrosopumilus sp. TaxID=2024843 RepID=UPI003B5919CA